MGEAQAHSPLHTVAALHRVRALTEFSTKSCLSPEDAAEPRGHPGLKGRLPGAHHSRRLQLGPIWLCSIFTPSSTEGVFPAAHARPTGYSPQRFRRC